MAGAGPSLQKQIPIVLQMPADESDVVTAKLVQEMRSIANEIRGYAQRIEAAAANEHLFWTEEELAEMFRSRGVKISILTIQRERRKGRIGFKRVAGKPVFTRRHIEEFLSSGN
jgi:hypothetical protein